MMTMLVATLGLLPAAMSHAIGSDSQRPFAIVIVGGLVADLVVSVFVLPTLYVWWARPDDQLPPTRVRGTRSLTGAVVRRARLPLHRRRSPPLIEPLMEIE